MKQEDPKKELACDLKQAYDIVSPFIERHTAKVCPLCKKVCCIDRHGHYDGDDIIFFRALGIETSHDVHDRKETDPCRFLGKKGCSLDRWRRPYRCTFFFCGPLLKSLENDNAKLYRAFMEYFQYLVDTRLKFLE